MKKSFLLFLMLASCKVSDPQKEALQTVTDFLGWYSTNYNQANSFGLVNQGDSVFYSVNFEEAEKYLAYLKSSGFVSDAYLNNFRTYFKESDEVFKKDPINEGPPPGFDYDIVLYTQEPELVIQKRAQPKIISSEIRDDTATLNLDMEMKLQFVLSKQDGAWKIDKISYFEEK